MHKKYSVPSEDLDNITARELDFGSLAFVTSAKLVRNLVQLRIKSVFVFSTLGCGAASSRCIYATPGAEILLCRRFSKMFPTAYIISATLISRTVAACIYKHCAVRITRCRLCNTRGTDVAPPQGYMVSRGCNVLNSYTCTYASPKCREAGSRRYKTINFWSTGAVHRLFSDRLTRDTDRRTFGRLLSVLCEKKVGVTLRLLCVLHT